MNNHSETLQKSYTTHSKQTKEDGGISANAHSVFVKYNFELFFSNNYLFKYIIIHFIQVHKSTFLNEFSFFLNMFNK